MGLSIGQQTGAGQAKLGWEQQAAQGQEQQGQGQGRERQGREQQANGQGRAGSAIKQGWGQQAGMGPASRDRGTVFPRSDAAATINFPLLGLAATIRGRRLLEGGVNYTLHEVVYCLAASILIMSCSKVLFLVVIIVS